MADGTHAAAVTDDSFASDIEGYDGLAMVDFWAVWCGPCRIVAPVVEELAGEYSGKGVRVAKLDTDSNPRTTARFGVRSIPSILFFKDGKHVDTVVGAVPKSALQKKIEEHI